MSANWIEKKPYWLKPGGVITIEQKMGATFMGAWCIKNKAGGWAEEPVDVFYQPAPDLSKGHTHYFGMFVRGEKLFITNAITAFEAPMLGALLSTGEVLVSRFRHDFSQKENVFVDGGRDYFRSSAPITVVEVSVEGPEFRFVPHMLETTREPAGA